MFLASQSAYVRVSPDPKLHGTSILQELLVLVFRYGVSRRLFEDFLRPLLLVGLFAPAEELSAAVMIGTLYFYGTNTHVPSTVIQWPSIDKAIAGTMRCV